MQEDSNSSDIYTESIINNVNDICTAMVISMDQV